MIEVAVFSSPIGRLELAVRDGRLCALAPIWSRQPLARRSAHRRDEQVEGPEQVEAREQVEGREQVEPGASDPAAVLQALGRFFDGDVRAIDALDVELSGTPFQQRAWLAMREI